MRFCFLTYVLQLLRIYNAADTIYYKIADKLEAYLDNYINSHVTYEPL